MDRFIAFLEKLETSMRLQPLAPAEISHLKWIGLVAVFGWCLWTATILVRLEMAKKRNSK